MSQASPPQAIQYGEEEQGVGVHKASRRSTRLRKLYSFIIIRNFTAALPVLATLFVSSVPMLPNNGF